MGVAPRSGEPQPPTSTMGGGVTKAELGVFKEPFAFSAQNAKDTLQNGRTFRTLLWFSLKVLQYFRHRRRNEASPAATAGRCGEQHSPGGSPRAGCCRICYFHPPYPRISVLFGTQTEQYSVDYKVLVGALSPLLDPASAGRPKAGGVRGEPLRHRRQASSRKKGQHPPAFFVEKRRLERPTPTSRT